jgi:hypothetical protein
MVLGGLVVAAVTACSNSTPPSSNATSPAATTPAATTPAATSTTSPSASGATAAITTNWETFFNSKTPVNKKVAVLEDGSQFTKIISEQLHVPLAAGLTAKVTSVSNVTATSATVKYDLVVGGSKVPMTGMAVYQDGTWKVGVATFCSLLGLEGLKNIPATCTSAG